LRLRINPKKATEKTAEATTVSIIAAWAVPTSREGEAEIDRSAIQMGIDKTSNAMFSPTRRIRVRRGFWSKFNIASVYHCALINRLRWSIETQLDRKTS